MTSKEYTAMCRSFDRVKVMMDLLQYWFLHKKTREMFNEAFELRWAGRYQESLDMIEEVLAHGKAFSGGYAIPYIILDKRHQDGSAKFIARAYIIEKGRDLEQEIIYCEDEAFRIEHCEIKTRKDDPIRYASGDMFVFQGRKVEEAEAGEVLEAPWNNPDLVKERMFSKDNPFSGHAPARISRPCSHSFLSPDPLEAS